MKFLILDVYPNNDHRLVKDTAGGYGTGNDFGNSLVAKILKYLIRKNSDWPPVYAAYTYSVLEKKGQLKD